MYAIRSYYGELIVPGPASLRWGDRVLINDPDSHYALFVSDRAGSAAGFGTARPLVLVGSYVSRGQLAKVLPDIAHE